MKTILRNAVIAVVVAVVLISISSTLVPFLMHFISADWIVMGVTACILISWFFLKAYRHVQTAKEPKEIQISNALTSARAHTYISKSHVIAEPEGKTLFSTRSAHATRWPTKPTFFKVKVRRAVGSGESFTLEVANYETIGTLRRRIAEITGMPFEIIELMLEGRKVADRKRMKDLTLKGDEVFVVALSPLSQSVRALLHITKCPYCGSSSLSRSESGELMCLQCGAVINARRTK